MAKKQTRYVCQSCGAVYTRWQGQCHDCNEWNSISEELPDSPLSNTVRQKGNLRASPKIELHPLAGEFENKPRLKTHIGELDRVLGGGVVRGSAILIGGDPGIGKSTLLLQAAAQLSRQHKVAYFSGEEGVEQIRMRAVRLNISDAPLELAAASQVGAIAATLDQPGGPEIAIIDSIQTMFVEALETAPGTVGQVRASAQELIKIAKRRQIALFIVGHVTKDGAIAGPRVLEHMVDAVLYFEGERAHPFRILRGVKNRFGATDEIGVFDMTSDGLQEVLNPSELFLEDRNQGVAGSVVFAGIEGSRPLLVEVQALVAPSPYTTPKRSAVGWDLGRLSMILAVLEARAGFRFSGHDVYLNVVGGLRITEPAADFAMAMALVSSLSGEVIPADTVIFGEVGLSGEIRRVNLPDTRLKEATKLGFKKSLMPAKGSDTFKMQNGMTIERIKTLGDLDRFFPAAMTS